MTNSYFETIIGSGPNSALPHYTVGERVLQAGDNMLIDFGDVYQGFGDYFIHRTGNGINIEVLKIHTKELIEI